MREVRTSRYRLALVGAGRRRQGTGPFLANYLKHLGQPPCAVIGGDPDRAQAAAENLARQFNIQASAHSSLRQLGAQEKVDALVIASPTPTHLHYLNEGIRQSCHVFCEKPLWWPATMETPGADRLKRITQNLLTGFAGNGKTLHLNQQWPFTLETFWRLYPSLSKKPQAIQEFSMKLSPRSQGQTMVLDAAPHLLSMLYALLGEGSIERLSCKKSGDHQCRLSFAYHHQSAQTAVRLKLNRHISQPRPAAYAINGHWVKRCVKLDNYSLSLDNGEQTMPMPDPLKKSLERFLSALRKNSGLKSGEARLLLKGMQDLHQLVSAYE